MQGANSEIHIDPATGALLFTDLRLRVPFLTRWKNFPEALKQLIRSTEKPGMGWISHQIGPFIFYNIRVVTSFGFHYTELKTVYFSVLDETPDEQPILQKAFETDLGVSLIKDGFTQLRWGSAVCCYHPKDGSLFAGIQHKSL